MQWLTTGYCLARRTCTLTEIYCGDEDISVLATLFGGGRYSNCEWLALNHMIGTAAEHVLGWYSYLWSMILRVETIAIVFVTIFCVCVAGNG